MRSGAPCAALHARVVLPLLPGRSFQVTSPPWKKRGQAEVRVLRGPAAGQGPKWVEAARVRESGTGRGWKASA